MKHALYLAFIASLVLVAACDETPAEDTGTWDTADVYSNAFHCPACEALDAARD